MRLRKRAVGARGGFTLLEITIAMAVLATAYVGYSKSVVVSMRAARAEREQALAAAAVRQVLAEVQASPFDQVWALYNDDPADDPGGAGTAPGPDLDVTGLTALNSDADGCAIEVLLPGTQVGGLWQLREDVNDDALGCPRDLTGDGAVDALDHSGDYEVLPVVVRARWRGVAGTCSYELRTSLVNI